MYIGPSGITKVEDKKGRRPACPFCVLIVVIGISAII